MPGATTSGVTVTLTQAFDLAVARWLVATPASRITRLEDVSSVRVVHEPAWSNDNGTSWPEEITIVYTAWGQVGKSGRRRESRPVSVYAGSSAVDFMRELFEEADS